MSDSPLAAAIQAVAEPTIEDRRRAYRLVFNLVANCLNQHPDLEPGVIAATENIRDSMHRAGFPEHYPMPTRIRPPEIDARCQTCGGGIRREDFNGDLGWVHVEFEGNPHRAMPETKP